MITLNDVYKKIVCLNNNMVFKDLKEASEYSGSDVLEIIYCCKEIDLYCKNKDNEKITWRFYDDFLNMDKESKDRILDTIKNDTSEFKDKIICLDANYVYNNIKDASFDTNVSAHMIKRCCDDAGTYVFNKNRKKHSFMYMEEYALLKEEEKIEIRNQITTQINRPVICLNLDKEFKTIDEASKFTNIPIDSIENNCNKRTHFVRNENNEKFIFINYEEFSKLDEVEKKEKIKEAKLLCLDRRSKVICLNNKEVFDSVKEASKATQISEDNIQKCCSKRRKFNIREDGERFKFMYYTEYLLLDKKDRKKELKKVNDINIKKVVNVETGETYESVEDASRHSPLSAFTIRQQCNKKERYSIKSKIDGPSWLYYEEYCKRLKRGKIVNKQKNADEGLDEKIMQEVALTQ